jgi:hypothetical protein
MTTNQARAAEVIGVRIDDPSGQGPRWICEGCYAPAGECYCCDDHHDY